MEVALVASLVGLGRRMWWCWEDMMLLLIVTPISADSFTMLL